MTNPTPQPENLAGMSGNEAYEAYYRDVLVPDMAGLPKVAHDAIAIAFYAGITHAIAYVRAIQDE